MVKPYGQKKYTNQIQKIQLQSKKQFKKMYKIQYMGDFANY